jgi:murein DD-endopeptidase MepM/ murein hydrolase activator NlpD
MRRATPHPFSGIRRRASFVLAWLFPERQIILRTGLRRCCFRVSTPLQAVVATCAAAVTIWQGVVTTRWLDSAATIAVKDYQIVDLRVDREAAIESMSDFERRFRALTSRISTEMADIERNLTMLAEHDSVTNKPVAEYAAAGDGIRKSVLGRGRSRPLDAHLARLEQSLSELRARHSELLVTSAQTASEQLEELEGALSGIGIESGTLATDRADRCQTEIDPGGDAAERFGRGGPFLPADDVSAEAGPRGTLYATMRRWDDLFAALATLPLGRPVADMRVSSGFGRRRDPINRRMAVHAGVDYAGGYNTPVVATGGGVVTYANRNGRYGKLVQIDHGHGYVTRYAHLAEISVKVGQVVERGIRVGLVGSTGRSTGPHLHYELRVGNQPRDPLKFIEVGKNVFKRDTEVGAG